jgi:hypothetical protein
VTFARRRPLDKVGKIGEKGGKMLCWLRHRVPS